MSGTAFDNNEPDEDIIVLNAESNNFDEITISSEEEGEIAANKDNKFRNRESKDSKQKDNYSSDKKHKKKKKEKDKKKKKDRKSSKNEPKIVEKSKDDFKKPPAPPSNFEFESTWRESDIIADNLGIYNVIIAKVIKLFDEGNTMPFIARYRSHITNEMEPSTLRKIESHLSELRTVKKKMKSVASTLSKYGWLSNELASRIRCCTTIEEIEYLFAPFKPGSKRSKAHKARDLGLEHFALKLIENQSDDVLREMEKAVVPNKEGLQNIKEVRKGVQFIISDIIAKDKMCLDYIREVCGNRRDGIRIRCSQAPERPLEEENETVISYQPNPQKDLFQNYYHFDASALNIKPHQVLAINRGEAQKELTVQMVVGGYVVDKWGEFCRRKYLPRKTSFQIAAMITASIDDAFSRLVSPVLIRECRSRLTKQAEKASLEVFASNLRSMLLSPPVRGKVILGVDPGYSHGCKWAVISPVNTILLDLERII